MKDEHGMGELCEQFRQFVSERPLEDQSAQTPGRFAEHLSGCESCRTFLKEFAVLQNSLGALVLAAPPELYGSVLNALPTHRRKFNLKLALILLVLMAAMTALAVEWYVYLRSQGDPGNCGTAVTSTSNSQCKDVKVSTEEYLQTSPL